MEDKEKTILERKRKIREALEGKCFQVQMSFMHLWVASAVCTVQDQLEGQSLRNQ